MIDAAWEGVIIDRSAASLQPCQQARACCFHKFELHWPLRLTLHHDRAGTNTSARHEVADLHLHDVTATQLAVDGKIKQGPVVQPSS